MKSKVLIEDKTLIKGFSNLNSLFVGSPTQ